MGKVGVVGGDCDNVIGVGSKGGLEFGVDGGSELGVEAI